jgi:hypothetical protein
MHRSGHEGIGTQPRHRPPAGRAIQSIQPSSNTRGGVYEDREASHLWRNHDCVRVARPIPPARRSRNSASLSAPRVIRGGRAGSSGSRPPGERKHSSAGMRGTMPTAKHDTTGLGVTRSLSTRGPCCGVHETDGVSIACEECREVRPRSEGSAFQAGERKKGAAYVIHLP